jgi:hypothetical protein
MVVFALDRQQEPLSGGYLIGEARYVPQEADSPVPAQ